MKMKKLFLLALAGFTLLAGCKKETITAPPLSLTEGDSSILVAGYLLSASAPTFNNSNYKYVNRINFFSLVPDAAGKFVFTVSDSSNLALVKSRMDATQQLFVTLGGPTAGGNIKVMAQDSAKRSQYVNDVMSFCNQWKIKGVDFDWEVFNNVQPDSSLYRVVCQKLSDTLHASGYLLTASIGVAPSASGPTSKLLLAKNIVKYVDGINVMACDKDVMDNVGFQATMFQVQNYLNMFVLNSVPASKILLAVPFHGYSTAATPASIAYSAITNAVPGLNAGVNLHLNYGFNGVTLLKDKTRYLRHNGFGGIVAWDLGQDVTGTDDNSLIKAIYEANK